MMMKKMSLVLGIMFAALVMFPAGSAMADSTLCESDISRELKEQAGCYLTSSDTAPSVIQSLINVAVGIIGIGAVAVMVYGGFIYTKSTGDAAKTKKARDILIYGGVGLIVSILAFAIVNFVLAGISG